jgi:Domain of unknown function (DUF4129)
MQPDRLAVVLRPRVGWEALDLGFQMAREWWRPVWAVWFSVYLPVAALCLLGFSNRLHAVLLLWWLKPVFDRAVLHTVSRAVFGEPQGVRATLRATREWLLPGIVMALTLSRLNLARSFALPVAQLEGQRGADARRRHAALGSRMRNVGVWLTVVCANLEWIVMFGLVGMEGMLEPPSGELGPEDYDAGGSFWAQFARWGLKDALFYMAAVSLVEPFYVTAGFALYLNRRAILEGWDIELALRRLEERLRVSAGRIAVVLVLAVAMSCALCGSQPAFALDAAGKSAPEEIREVFKSPEFSQKREATRWHYIGKPDAADPRDVPAFWQQLSALFGRMAEVVLWVAAVLLLAAAVYYLRRFIPEPQLYDGPGYRPPDALFGFDLAPESLPDDVADTAKELARNGRPREALSLLYRGALSALVHRHRLQLDAGDTEGECALAVGRTLPQSADYFFRLVETWQALAYAARRADAAAIERLCDEWRPHFSPDGSP